MLWKFLSHLMMNYLPLADIANLRELLRLYIFPGLDRGMAAANFKRIEGLVELRARPEERLVRGVLVRGHAIQLQAREDCFAGLGDLFLFGCILDLFMGVFCSLNSYTQLTLRESIRGETFTWPARIGTRPLA
jgi:type VI secretion system protein ImpG